MFNVNLQTLSFTTNTYKVLKKFRFNKFELELKCLKNVRPGGNHIKDIYLKISHNFLSGAFFGIINIQ